jgi:hypothetical protein
LLSVISSCMPFVYRTFAILMLYKEDGMIRVISYII